MTDRTETATPVSPDDLDAAVQDGELTQQQADTKLQEAARRRAATEGPVTDTDSEGQTTQGGFGSGQGMASKNDSKD